MNKFILILIAICFIPLSLAAVSFPSGTEIFNDENITLAVGCSNCNLTSICKIAAFNPDSTVLFNGDLIRNTSNGVYFKTLPSKLPLGQYLISAGCDCGDTSCVTEGYFIVKGQGADSEKFVFIILGLALTLIIIGLTLSNEWIIGFSGFLFLALGLLILGKGLIGYHTWLSNIISLVLVFSGVYVLFKSGYEQFQ